MNNYDYDVLLINPTLNYFENKLGSIDGQATLKNNMLKPFNPGLLSIGTYLDSKRNIIKILDLANEDPPYPTLLSYLKKEKPLIIGISCTYALSYLSTLEIAKIAQKASSDSLIVVGGRHAGSIGAFPFIESNFSIDIVIKYEGEIPLEEILQAKKSNMQISKIKGIIFQKNLLTPGESTSDLIYPIIFTISDQGNEIITHTISDGKLYENPHYSDVVDINDLPFLKYELYPDYLSYPPYIEESRGCPGGCEYCVSPTFCKRRIRIKNSQRFLDELEYTVNIFGNKQLYHVLASTFGVNAKNTIDICNGIIKRFGTLNWLTEIRVDVMWEKYLQLMYQSGLRVYAAGIESGSREILALMNKTHNPDEYLKKAKLLLNEVKKMSGTIMYVNFMFYLGESPSTIKESVKFLIDWNDKIDSISCSPLTIYPSTILWNDFLKYSKKFKTSLVTGEPWDTLHLYPVNPSKYFTFEEAGYHSRMMEKITRTEEGVYRLLELRMPKELKGKIQKKELFEEVLQDTGTNRTNLVKALL